MPTRSNLKEPEIEVMTTYGNNIAMKFVKELGGGERCDVVMGYSLNLENR